MPNALEARNSTKGVPFAGQILSMALSLVATTVLTLFLTQRALAITSWSRLPLVVWVVFLIYADSYLFVFATAMLQHAFGINTNQRTCDSAILLCLVCYVTTKLIYLFLVEKAHIIRGTPKSRIRSKLYVFNSFGMLGVYVVIVLLNFIYRISRLNNGRCIIGMQGLAMVPLISFDAVVNVYLTMLFLLPLRRLYSFRSMPRSPANIRLRTIAFRTFCGAVFTLVSSIINLSVLLALNGEPGWVCLMSCNCDILFSAVVIQWVTSRDNAGTSSTTSSRAATARRQLAGPSTSIAAKSPCRGLPTSPMTTADVSLTSTARSSPYRDDSDDVHAGYSTGHGHFKVDDAYGYSGRITAQGPLAPIPLMEMSPCHALAHPLNAVSRVPVTRPAPPGTVVITTTIRHESTPSADGTLDEPCQSGLQTPRASVVADCRKHSAGLDAQV
ncbi:hypothetical protein CDD81_3238 [Ophiocordyceps australis]|uniref:Uncharacterized protein n=1 Tax=Ophiocordyceps australis TaxID=1399860 RepID=A0A2C5Y8R7_9HYPO|nr:hypothetical protein CDD81_3238 [Ophiocordyceps australis]